ncbi:MAG: Ig-like domain-containing protein [Gemmatimonadaceae bacterium]
MNVMRRLFSVSGVIALAAASASPQAAARATAEDGLKVKSLEARPAQLTMEVGVTLPFKVIAKDSAGAEVNALFRLSGPRGAMRITDSSITALRAGNYEIVVSVVTPPNYTPVMLRVPARLTWPAIAKVEISSDATTVYAGTTVGHRAVAHHGNGSLRPDVVMRWASSDPNVATVDRSGQVTFHKAGRVTVSATAETTKGEVAYSVAAFPATSLEIDASETTVRTGDVVKVKSVMKNSSGRDVSDVPVTWSYTYVPDDSIAAPGASGIVEDGDFVGQWAGTYTILAMAGPLTARRSIDVRPRDVVQRVQVMGGGNIRHVHTSDLWTFVGKDGRDYALVGTWGGDGWAYMFDITNPQSMVKTDSVKIDARTINDVTVSPDARYGVLSREGASNRVNGVVVLDLAEPAHPKVVARFDEDLTGGVHNLFATNDYLFAISGGDKYVIIDMKDVNNPKRAGEYNHPDSRVHDIWVNDGIAYSSEWGTGIVMADVGNGNWGGTPQKPVLINTYPTKSGSTHEVFPYISKKTGKVYAFLGDEIMSRRGRAWEGTQSSLMEKGGVPQTMAGYTHIIDITDPKNPKNVARYEVAEFGTHDIIVEDDVLYQAYYDGGMRVVDVSGELRGNLGSQGREIAVYKSFDPQGYTANATMVMNAMPHKGTIFFTDFNSGLWSMKLQPKTVVP